MSLTDGNGMTPADVAAVTNGNNGFGFGGDGAWWMLILFLFAFGGWGNGNGWGNNGINGDIQRGFDQNAVMNGLNGLNATVAGGFADAAVAQCNQSMNFLNAFNGVQNQISNLGNNLTAIMMNNEMARQNCCCDTKLAIANLQNVIQNEGAADRTALSGALRDVIASNTANTQSIKDMLCQQETEALKTQIANLQTQLNMASLAASQNQQTNQIIRGINPAPVPAYVVQNPNGCNCGSYNTL